MIVVLGSVCLAWVLTQWAERVIERINKPNLMQFVCLRCWSFWLCLGIAYNEYGHTKEMYLMSAIAGFLASEYADYSFKKKEW